MRGWGGDILSVAAVLAMLLGFAAVFPHEAIGFSAAEGRAHARSAECAIVFLGQEAVATAMRATRILSKHEVGWGAAGADLLSAELPGEVAAPILRIDSRDRVRTPAVVEGGVPPFLPSRRAAAPVRISREKEESSLPFPRSELLRLN